MKCSDVKGSLQIDGGCVVQDVKERIASRTYTQKKKSQKKSHLRRNEKEKGTCQSTSTSASQLVKKKKKNGMKKYTQSKHQSKKSANQKTINLYLMVGAQGDLGASRRGSGGVRD